MLNIVMAGLGQIASKIQIINKQMKQKEIAAVKGGALIFQNEWKKNAPVKTGTYKRSIHSEVTKTEPDVVITVGEDITRPPYPYYLEYGTRSKTGKQMIKPRLTATTAFEKTKYQVINEVKRLMKIAGLNK